jgi:hypothetical protein
MSAEVARDQRDRRIVACETIGGALAVLRRMDYIWCDDDVRDALTRARSILSVAQSTAKERIDGAASTTTKKEEP